MALTTPPSTRTAAPFVAEESSLATKVTIAATSSTVAKRFSKDEGRTCSKNSFSITCFDLFCCFAIASTKPPTPSDSVGPARTLVHRHAGAGHRLCNSARHGNLRRLGHPIVHHLGRSLHRRLARNEKNAAPVFLHHSGEIVSCQPHAAHDV